jgi:ankyrin repeat protein
MSENLNKNLINAIINGQTEKVEMYLNNGADPNYKTYNNDTALTVSLKFNKTTDILELLLLKNNINTNIIFNQGQDTPLNFCIKNMDKIDVERIKLLLEYGADPNFGNIYEQKPLNVWAVNANPYNYSLKILNLLLLYGVNINSLNYNNETPLFRAAIRDNSFVVHYLMINGADPYIKNNRNINVFNTSSVQYDQLNHIKGLMEELHKKNVAYQMLNIAKGISEDPLQELTDDVLEKIYKKLINEPYNAKITSNRVQEDLEDIRMSIFIESIM